GVSTMAISMLEERLETWQQTAPSARADDVDASLLWMVSSATRAQRWPSVMRPEGQDSTAGACVYRPADAVHVVVETSPDGVDTPLARLRAAMVDLGLAEDVVETLTGVAKAAAAVQTLGQLSPESSHSGARSETAEAPLVA